VAVVDKNAEKKGNEQIAEAYLKHLYSPAGQEIAAKNFYRPRSNKVPADLTAKFPKLKLYTVDDSFGGWANAQKTHFADGGVFDSIYQPQ
jgi:sulfate transport system substrate-binding protein